MLKSTLLALCVAAICQFVVGPVLDTGVSKLPHKSHAAHAAVCTEDSACWLPALYGNGKGHIPISNSPFGA